MTLPSRILLTGAAGRVGKALRPILREQYDQVLLSDLKEIDDCQGSESFKQGDIAEFEFVKSLAGACEGIVHLAGLVGSKFTFEENIGPNYVGTHNLFRAAVESGIKNVVYASSHRVRDAATDPSALNSKPGLNTIEEGVVGGGFAAVDFAGDKDRVLGSR